MTFPTGAQSKRTNYSGIDAKEYDAIVAALQSDPDAIEQIAQTFNRSFTTIDKIRERVGIDRRRLPYGSCK